jgi:hypothetical protein
LIDKIHCFINRVTQNVFHRLILIISTDVIKKNLFVKIADIMKNLTFVRKSIGKFKIVLKREPFDCKRQQNFVWKKGEYSSSYNLYISF